MPKTVPNAFTLVELLVVIAIMAIIGAYTLSNYASFGEDQKLKNAVLDVVSLLRQAQTNASSQVKCHITDTNSAVIRVFATKNIGLLKCKQPSDLNFDTIKSLRLDLLYPNITIKTVSGDPSTSCPTYNFGGFKVEFMSLTGKINFMDDSWIDKPNCNSLTITLINSKISPDCTGANLAKCKSLIIEKGGRIYAE